MGYDGNLKKNNCNFELYKLCIAVMFHNVWRLWSYKVRRSVTQAVHWVPARRLLCLMVENHQLCHLWQKRVRKQASRVQQSTSLTVVAGELWVSRLKRACAIDFYLLYLYVTHTVGASPNTLTSCDTYCMWATYVSQLVPHMCRNMCHICVTCPTCVSQLVPNICHILSTEVRDFCETLKRKLWATLLQQILKSRE